MRTADINTLRRFVPARELQDNQALNNLLRDVIDPKFARIGQPLENKYGIINVEDSITVDNSVNIMYRIVLFEFQQIVNERTDITTYIDQYYANKDSILSRLYDDMTPSIRDSLVIQSGLSPDQFMISTHKITLHPIFSTYMSGMSGEVGGYVDIELILSIEIISELGLGTVQSQYNDLCKQLSQYSTYDIQKWAGSLGIGGYENMDRAALCANIQEYYELD